MSEKFIKIQLIKGGQKGTTRYNSVKAVNVLSGGVLELHLPDEADPITRREKKVKILLGPWTWDTVRIEE